MMLLSIEQQKIRILKMSRDFTDLPTDKLADLKNNENFDRTFISQNSQFFAIIPHNFRYKIEKNYVRNTSYRKCLWCIKY